MRFLVSGGGTGGHVYPALAVARALRDVRPDAELAYVGGARGLERRIVTEQGWPPYHQLLVRSLRSVGLDHHLVLDPVRLGASVPQAWWLLGRLRPSAVFTSGGYLGIPLVMAARARGVPSVVWEGNVVPGKATRLVGRLASRVAVSFEPTLAAFGERAFVSGTPIRSFAGVDRVTARASFGVGEGERLLLVFGGSQAVARITEALRAALPAILPAWRVLHITGEPGLPEAERVRSGLPEGLRDRYQPVAFLTDRMADALIAADLVLGRSGSSTCAEVAAVGVASILVPYPHAGAHQRANAKWLADKGAAVVVPDEELTGERLAAEVERLADDATRATMAEAARALGRPDAAARIAAEVVAL
ncbi:MAG TPA: UDP-N-acetylglucosamine--N-acetylmuramyl-(pentapeptide) pyrophosphoryl-undecaprenol N-acetylglucosamine transferase, partial [candidate division Zixibacteria bacterium]|nr:UDP-N-acetylglucosamine--N-acetylmuramyl-(pentapeptide) pyrophosphoryl-undecaprenol N-acetylglucosamine transferase [candidate division Zixibacteria bacterium]